MTDCPVSYGVLRHPTVSHGVLRYPTASNEVLRLPTVSCDVLLQMSMFYRTHVYNGGSMSNEIYDDLSDVGCLEVSVLFVTR